MSSLFEITGDDIALLNDSQLRELIGLLCEADYRSSNLATKGITWGGNQDAPDGGFDVVVDTNFPPPTNSYIPRKNTVFQVKKPDMPPNKIIKEMKPNGSLRSGINDLIKIGGAYVIVSSTGSTSESALKKRVDAMRNVVKTEIGHQNLHLEFMDRGQIASWVRMHPSYILWVRNKIGRPLKGWKPYGNWAYNTTQLGDEYILDDSFRLRDGTKRSFEELSVEHGLNRLRQILSTPRSCVRLVGLSGVGKTRLVQAFFDEKIGKNPLNCSQVYYTDTSDRPEPDPQSFLETLLARKEKGVLIIDNCPADLHRKLAELCSTEDSHLCLVTIEYDIRDDLPDETDVFRLEPANNEIIKKLIERHFEHVSQVDAGTIAVNSGGNFRLAIALAKTVKRGETLTGLKDNELFNRLFEQRHAPNTDLMKSAEACSLVYSFDGEDINSDNSELIILSSLINKPPEDFYRNIQDLRDRELIQSRSVWRALLPQAVANRLAIQALKNIHQDVIFSTFSNSNATRLLKSFTKRIGFLHDSPIAVQIVENWLAPEGWLGNALDFGDLEIEILQNIAPASPEKALEAVERGANAPSGDLFTSRKNPYYYEIARLLRSIAYDPQFFKRSVRIIYRFVLSEIPNENVNSTRDVLRSLFFIYLSGTHASAEDRLGIIDELINLTDPKAQEIGLFLLEATLEAWHFTSIQKFDFGARPRDYGHTPNTSAQVQTWYRFFINYCQQLAISDNPLSYKARKILADQFRGLWTRAGMWNELEVASKKLQSTQPWNEGWVAVRESLRFDFKKESSDIEVKQRLNQLEELLRPKDLAQKVRAYAFADRHYALDDLDEQIDAVTRWNRIDEIIFELGIMVAKDPDALQELIPELISNHRQKLFTFGGGLAKGCENRTELWTKLINKTKETEQEDANINLLLGFLNSASQVDHAFCNSALDDLLNDSLLGKDFPYFQNSVGIDQNGIDRLHKALDLELAPIEAFRNIALGQTHNSFSEGELINLLRKIAQKEKGINVAVNILFMQLNKPGNNYSTCNNKLISFGRELLTKWKFTNDDRGLIDLDYELSIIAENCLTGEIGEKATIALAKNFVSAKLELHINHFDYKSLLNTLAKIQPEVFLDIFLGHEDIDNYELMGIFDGDSDIFENPLTKITGLTIIGWCNRNPKVRYPLIAHSISTFEEEKGSGKIEWNPIIYSILERAPDPEPIMNCLVDSLSPSCWSGSRAEIIQRRLVLLERLLDHPNNNVVSLAKEKIEYLNLRIDEERKREKKYREERDERFE